MSRWRRWATIGAVRIGTFWQARLGRGVAGATGVTGQAVIPVPLVLLAVPATLLLANLTATGPGWTAAHTSAALILSSE
jgi:hypothetical protein